MKDTELVNELFELWKNLGEVGELHITKGYSDRMQMLQERVNKYNSLHNVSESLPSFEEAEDEAANHTDGIDASIYYLEGFNVGFLNGYDWIMSKVNTR